jgi:hypothetical protein
MAETPDMLAACHAYIKERVFPLVYVVDDDRAVVQGTGFLLEHEAQVYLVTAKHVLEGGAGFEYERLAFPVSGPKREMYSLPHAPYLSNRQSDADVAVVPLRYSSEILASLHWRTLTLDSFYTRSQLFENQAVFVYGFPTTLQQSPTAVPFVNIGVIAFTTTLYTDDPSAIQGYDPFIDIVFSYRSEMIIDGAVRQVPDLHGISGSPMFCIDHEVNGLWSADRCLKIIGMQKAVKKNSYIKATKSTCLEPSLRTLLRDISRPGRANAAST